MCDPLSLGLMLGAGALSAGGAKINADSQNAAIDAQNQANKQAMIANNQAAEAEAARQNQMFDQQLEQISQTLAQANPAAATERVQRAATSPENPVASAPAAYNSAPLQGQYVNEDIAAHSAGKVDESRKRATDLASALARLTALDVDAAGVGDAINQGSSNVRTIGSNRTGSLNANRAETNIQPHKITPSRSLAGDLMVLGGQFGGGVAGQMMGGNSLGNIILGRRS